MTTLQLQRPSSQSATAKALQTFGAMLLREVRVIRREFAAFVLRTIMQPFFFLDYGMVRTLGRGPATPWLR